MGIFAPPPTGNGSTALVSTVETTTSTTYTDLATTTDTVTVTIGASGCCLVGVRCEFSISVAGQASYMSFAGSGANTVAASDTNSVATSTSTGLDFGCSTLLTGLNPGSTTFKAKYRVTANTGTFGFRKIFAIPL